ncbi:hypothetical protein P691DRAFT_634991, partial [Macrolepiota fuliginosa MF-IS2]
VPVIKREPIETPVPAAQELDAVQQDVSRLKDTVEINQKKMQSYFDSLKAMIQNGFSRQPSGNYQQGQVMESRAVRPSGPPMNYSNPPPRQDCFYCHKDGHRWLVCPEKIQDEKDGKIVHDGDRLRFADGSGIPREKGLSIRQCVEKYLPTAIVNMIYGMPNLANEDDKPDTGYPSPYSGSVA